MFEGPPGKNSNETSDPVEVENEVPDYSAVIDTKEPSINNEEPVHGGDNLNGKYDVAEETPYGPVLRKVIEEGSDDSSVEYDVVQETPYGPTLRKEGFPSEKPEEKEEEMDTELTDLEVALAEEEIYSHEIENRIEKRNLEINSLREKIDEVNEKVRGHKMDTEVADLEVALAEEEIRDLELANKEEFEEEIDDAEEEKAEEEEEQEEGDEEGPESAEMDEYEKEKVEYLRLKKEFKTREREYYDAIENDYGNRGKLIKFFGLGRNDMNPEVQEAYDKFMEANKVYYKYAQDTGVYEKIVERLHRDKEDDEPVKINSAVAGRHVLTPAEKRLELQTVKMPEKLINLKEKTLSLIKNRPVTAGIAAASAVGYSLFVNPAAVVAGVSTRYIGKKLYVDGLQEKQETFKTNTEESFEEPFMVDLEEMEDKYFSTINRAHNAKNRVNMAAVGAAMGAGTVSSMEFGGDSLVPEADVAGPDTSTGTPEETTIGSDGEKTHFDIARDRIQDLREKTAENNTRALELAKKLNIEIKDDLDYKMRFGAITEIEGVSVPEEYHLNKEGVLVDVEALKKQFGVEEADAVDAALDTENTTAPSGVEIISEPAQKATISKEYENLVHTMDVKDMNGLSYLDRIKDYFTREQITVLHEILADTLAKGIDSGDIVLPDPLIVNGVDYTNDLAGYVAEKLPDVTRNWGDYFTPHELTEEQWQMLGIRSGEPNSMYLGEKVKIGELLKYVMRDELAPVPQDGNIVNEIVQDGQKFGIGEDGKMYKDGQAVNSSVELTKSQGTAPEVTEAPQDANFAPEITVVDPETAEKTIPSEILERLRSSEPEDYKLEKLPDGGERWINSKNPDDYIEIKDGEKTYGKDFFERK